MENKFLADTKNAVYKLYTTGGTATAFYVREHDCFVTNYHAVEGCREVALEDHGQYRYKAAVVLVDPANDIALLACAGAPKDFSVVINPGLAIAEAERVTVLGFPYGPFSVTEGIVSNKARIHNHKTVIQTDAAINPGNSGGPVVNRNGELVAIASAKLTGSDSTGFGIPYTVLLQVMRRLSAATPGGFTVCCESCGNALAQSGAYCNACGAAVNSAHFGQKEGERFAPVIEAAIQAAGTDPVLARNGRLYWEFHNGSALIRIFVYKEKFIFATSPLNTLGGTQLEALYRYLTSNEGAPFTFGIHGNDVFLSHRFAITDLYGPMKSTVLSQLTDFIQRTDAVDNFIEDTFGCPKTVYARA